jgi:carbon monoxide dehydrogenase subunit G
MTVKVSINLDRKFTVAADIDTVFALLSDIPASAEHFPKVQALTPLSDNEYRWEMKKVSLGLHSVQTVYACEYTSDNNSKTIFWTPIKGEGNAIVSGKWELHESPDGTSVSFHTKADLTIPLPGLLKMAISPAVKIEFSGMVDSYLRSLQSIWA